MATFWFILELSLIVAFRGNFNFVHFVHRKKVKMVAECVEYDGWDMIKELFRISYKLRLKNLRKW